ncbi:MAG: HD domain-containing protein [Candidatus Colwellbacteria bacterium]|nr:HD domain-containing protein [Candidatus Colwellbacteria bacterium]MBI3274289.1 HD domain-containing protein [Candidatus Colwellbacteria bacterium]
MSKAFEHFLDRSLAHVIRFNGQPQQFSESVAEHSFYVAYFTSVIVYFLKKCGEDIDEAKALKIALVHDMEEAISGDILTPFKHYNNEILEAIRKVNRDTIPLVFEDLPNDLKMQFISFWNEDTEQVTKEAQVVKLADKISLICKCYEEVKVGNEFFKPIYEKELEKIKTLDYPWWNKIREQIL